MLSWLALAVFVPGGLTGLAARALAAGARGRVDGVHRLAGEVRFNGQVLKVGDKVAPPVEVTTGAGGLALFVIGGSAYLVREHSRLRVGADSAAQKGLLELPRGRVLAVFDPRDARGERPVRTVTATLGIRGSGVYLHSMPDRTYACLCYGQATLTPDGAPGRAEWVSTRHHESPRYIYHDRLERAAVIDHTDDELILLEGLTGRVPPFYAAYMEYGKDGVLGDLEREKRYKEPR